MSLNKFQLRKIERKENNRNYLDNLIGNQNGGGYIISNSTSVERIKKNSSGAGHTRPAHFYRKILFVTHNMNIKTQE